jgi:hypothetical protein
VSEPRTGLLSATYHVDSLSMRGAPHTESRWAEERVRRMVNEKILEILSDGRTYTVTIAPTVELRRDNYPPYPTLLTQYAYVWISSVEQCEVGECVPIWTFHWDAATGETYHQTHTGRLFNRTRNGWERVS